jgi:putative colanic acid biosynthesis glycosyltransferase
VKILPGTINSVVGQTARADCEYLIVDGHSTDGTVDLITTAANHRQIDGWLSEPDVGIYDAMNKAVRMAKGEWIIFMNAGDRFESDQTLAQVLPVLRSTLIDDGILPDLVYGDCYMVLPDGTPRYDQALAPHRIRYQMVCSHQSLFVRRQLLTRFPFDVAFSVCADHLFLLRCLDAGCVTVVLDVPVARVQIERYSLTQLIAGHLQKWRAVSLIWPGLKTAWHFGWRFLRLFAAHSVKNLIQSTRLKRK